MVLSDLRGAILNLFNQPHSTPPSATADFSSVFSAALGAEQKLQPNIALRSGNPLAINRLSNDSMLPIRAAKASALQSRLASSSSISSSHNRKARMQAMAADNRGRLFIAESSSVLIANAIPIVNTRCMPNPQGTHLIRSQLNILGSDSIKPGFPIQGMSVCDDNNRHLLVWGVSKVCVAILSKSSDSFDRVIELKVNLDSSECESQY